MPYTDLSVSAFLDALASSEPTPGGGSSAALGGALGAALVSMVCRLTIGRHGYEAAEERLKAVLTEAETARLELQALLEEDTRAYGAVMAAHRLPRQSPEQRATRDRALQTAMMAATEVPLRIGERCARVLKLALTAAELGNTWAVSDAAAGAMIAEASMRAALLNVEINVATMHDASCASEARATAERIAEDTETLRCRVLEIARQRMRV